MFGNTRTRTRTTAFALAALVVGSLAACSTGGSGPEQDPSSNATVDEEARALLPDSIADRGSLRLTSAFDYAPFAFLDDEGERTGADYEMGTMIAERLGLEADWTSLKGFSTLIPAVQNGRADVAIESFGITDERLGVVSFVSYASAYDVLVAAAGNPAGIDPTNICGASMAMPTGVTEQVLLEEYSADCVASGQEPIELIFFQTSQEGYLAVQNGRADLTFTGVGGAKQLVEETQGMLEVLSGPFTKFDSDELLVETTIGMVINKSEEGSALGAAIALALANMQADGSFDEILAEYGLEGTSAPAELIE